MDLFKNLDKKLKKKIEIFKRGAYVDIKTDKLRQLVEFILFSLPINLVRGIEMIEEMFDTEVEPHQIIVKPTMSPTDIRRQIGRYVFRTKRWKDQVVMANKLLAQERIDLETFYRAYDTRDYKTAYEFINADVFAVYYGNPTMSFDEVAVTINQLYAKGIDELNVSNQVKSFVDDLFQQSPQKPKS